MSEQDDFPETLEEAEKVAIGAFTYNPSLFGIEQDFVGAATRPCTNEGNWCLIGNWLPDGTRKVVYCDKNLLCRDGRIIQRE